MTYRPWAGPAPRIRILLLGLAFMVMAVCAPKPAPPPSPAQPPSRVITEGGLEFFSWEPKLPGTNEDFLLRQGGANTSLPLAMIRSLQLSGPERDGYRAGNITLVTGERTQGEIFVDRLIEGVTDLGYWNLSLRQIFCLDRAAP